jgi:DNA-binding NtrC family response regulator
MLLRDSFERLEQVRASSKPPPPAPLPGIVALTDHLSLRELRRTTEREYLAKLILHYAGDLDRAAQHARIHRKSLERLLRQHGLGRG